MPKRFTQVRHSYRANACMPSSDVHKALSFELSLWASWLAVTSCLSGLLDSYSEEVLCKDFIGRQINEQHIELALKLSIDIATRTLGIKMSFLTLTTRLLIKMSKMSSWFLQILTFQSLFHDLLMPGMFVLIWLHVSRVDSNIVMTFDNCDWSCRLDASARW